MGLSWKNNNDIIIIIIIIITNTYPGLLDYYCWKVGNRKRLGLQIKNPVKTNLDQAHLL